MSHHLWRCFLENDVESFKRHIENAVSRQTGSKATASARGGPIIGSPGGNRALSTSPAQTRKSSGTHSKGKVAASNILSRVELNAKDHQGLTLLHWVASSQEEDAWEFAQVLLEHGLTDLSLQDSESLWTPLHRALYFGNVTIARALLSRDLPNVKPHGAVIPGTLFKVKDREGNSPFDLFNASVAARSLQLAGSEARLTEFSDETDDISISEQGDVGHPISSRRNATGDELFVFGSNKNLNLGVGDEDDRQFPERVILKRPQHLLQRLRLEHHSCSPLRKNRLHGNDESSESIDLSGPNPALIEFKKISIIDIQLSKLHTAIVTDDPEANLYMCGFGPGGRLGTGDESTRFNFTCIYGGGLQGEKVRVLGLGQDHTLAITDNGEVLSWGSNRFGQLGYSISSAKDEEPVQPLPRKIFGTLKRESAIGCAASRIHSVVFTANNLYTFGKNEGQLGLVDSDARSLELQNTPRAVAASLFQHSIVQVTAIDKATACLLENTDVWIFANYGYTRVKFPLDDFANYFLRSTYSTARFGSEGPNHIIKLASGGDSIATLSSEGQVFSVNVSQSIEPAGKASTTNPVKIKNALSDPQKIWSPRKDMMSCADVDVGQDGSIMICTKFGSVWRRVKRTKAKDTTSVGLAAYKAKDYKFSRVPGLTCISAVRCNAYGSYAAIRHDWDVLRTQIPSPNKTVWRDLFSIFPFKDLSDLQEFGQIEVDPSKSYDLEAIRIRRAVLKDKDIEATLHGGTMTKQRDGYDIRLGSTATDVRIPCHEFILAGRSTCMRQALISLRESYLFNIPDILTVEYDEKGKPLVLFKGLDVLTLFNIVLYLYTDSIVDVWHYTKYSPEMTLRYKQVRVELMKIAPVLNLKELERAARLQVEPRRTLAQDMERAYVAPNFFEHADIEIELKGTSYYAHRALMVQRCPFFEGMFAGLSHGNWVHARHRHAESGSEDLLKVDMSHVEPEIFDLVLQHLYCDTGPELFDETTASNLDAFLDIVMEVMAVANELMLDNLSHVCQTVLGRFVNVRNVCQLLNAVSPCSVSLFKTAALEYICLNLEIMLENHLLDELDDDIMLELDGVVRDNQNSCFRYTQKGVLATQAMLEKYPDLEEKLNIAIKRKADSMALRARRLQREEEERLAKDNKSPKLGPKSPKLTGKASSHDLLFDMDEDGSRSPFSGPMIIDGRKNFRLEHANTPLGSPLDESPWLNNKGKPITGMLSSPAFGSLNGPATPSKAPQLHTPSDINSNAGSRNAESPWGKTSLRSEKLDMKQIMEQADEKRHSNISVGLSDQSEPLRSSNGPFKLSQKERKKQMQERQKRLAEDTVLNSCEPLANKEKAPAWQTVSSNNKLSLKEVLKQPLNTGTSTASNSKTKPYYPLQQKSSSKIEKPADHSDKPITSRQENKGKVSLPTRPIKPQIHQAGSSTKVKTQARVSFPKSPDDIKHISQAGNLSSRSTPGSLRYTQETPQPSLQLSMADILAQQQMEKDVIKEATAKRSLQEIQQEQEFMEWWEAEEKATKARVEAEERAAVHTSKRGGKQGSRGKGRQQGTSSGSGRGKGNHRNGPKASRESNGIEKPTELSSSNHGRGTWA